MMGTAQGSFDAHSHHALQISLADDRPLRFRRGDDSAWTSYDASIVPADLPHAFDADGERFAFIFVDPESPEGRTLAATTSRGDIMPISSGALRASAAALFRAFDTSHACAQLQPAAEAVVRSLAGTAPRSVAADPRVLGAIELIRARLDGRVGLTDVARELHISPSRLRHLFVAEVGLPFRTYVLWQRLQRVIHGIGTESLTSAALAAGFADAAHMTRTFRRMIGMSPSGIQRC